MKSSIGIIFALSVLLCGCAPLKNIVFPSKFDGGEYAKISQIRTSSTIGALSCSSSTKMADIATDLNNKTIDLMLYSQGLPENEEMVQMIANLNTITNGFYQHYTQAVINPVSREYCKEKMEIIKVTAAAIQQSSGSKRK